MRVPAWIPLLGLPACEAPAGPILPPEPVTPCLAGSVTCAERISIGPGLFLPLHSTHPLVTGAAGVSRAIIVVHGTDRNGDDYFERVVEATRLEGRTAETLVVAPTFQTVDDAPADDEPFWTSGGWKRGHRSSSAGPAPRVSSYAAMDHLLEAVLDPARFPDITDVVVTGHSAGGQVAHRFAAASRVENDGREVRIRYVVANPSSYLYPGPEREGVGGFTVPDPGACPDYDDWHYGLSGLNGYASAVTADSIRAQLVRRDVRVLLGDADTLDASLDVTCGANLQGRHRYERGRTLVRWLDALFPGHGHREMIVPGTGHSSARMYASPVGREALFGN